MRGYKITSSGSTSEPTKHSTCEFSGEFKNIPLIGRTHGTSGETSSVSTRIGTGFPGTGC